MATREEEILKSHYMKLPDACEEDWEVGSNDEMHGSILSAMREYGDLKARGMSKGFAEWCPLNGWVKNHFKNDMWLNEELETITTDQLYNLYIESLNK